MVLSSDGHIVTGNHVIAEGVVIAIMLADGSMRPASLVGVDRAFDLALLKVEGCHGPQLDSDRCRDQSGELGRGPR